MGSEMSETEFLKSYDPTKYARPSLATDAIVFGYFGGRIHTLLIQRKNHPFKGRWVFPGGFVEVYEDPDEGVRRELREETGVEIGELAQLAVFGRPDRDPRYHVISAAYIGVIAPEAAVVNADDDAANAAWHPVDHTPPLGFDHETVLQVALDRLRKEIHYPSFAMRFFQKGCTGAELLALYQAVLGQKIDPKRFLEGLVPACSSAPALDKPVRLHKQKLRDFESRLGAWWR